MNALLNLSQNRREFFRSGLRAALLLTLAALGGLLAMRRGPVGTDCRQSLCRGCASLTLCSQPQAIELKRSAGQP